MDVLVKWKDGTQNVVNTQELLPVRKGQKITVGIKVKMLYERKWWYGTVTVIEALESTSSEDEPLSFYASNNRMEDVQNCCEYINCHNPILSTCTKCASFLCTEHYEHEGSCSNHLASKTLLTENEHNRFETALNGMEYNPFDPHIDEMYIATSHEYQKCCQFSICMEEVFSVCHRCSCLLCYDHFINCFNCENHLTSSEAAVTPALLESNLNDVDQTCEFAKCTNPIMTTCFECACLLCDVHFESLFEVLSCADHAIRRANPSNYSSDFNSHNMENVSDDSDATITLSDSRNPSPSILGQVQQQADLAPEHYVVDGASREIERSQSQRKNKYKEAKSLLHTGKEHISPYTPIIRNREHVSYYENLPHD